MAEKPRRRSRVLEYFEQQQAAREEAEAAEQESANEDNPDGGGGDDPFQELDSHFGLAGFGPKGSE